MAPEGDNVTAVETSDQQNRVSSAPAVTSTTTSALPPGPPNDSEKDEIKPSNVQFHPTVKEAVPLSRTGRFFQAIYAMAPSIPASIQEGPTAINPDLHCNNPVKPGGQPRRELPENFQYYAERAGYGEGMLARAMENLPSLPAGLSNLPSLLTALPSMPAMPSMPSLSSMASMASMPAMSSLSSLSYRRGPERRARRFSDRSYTTLLEPFEPVENPVDQTEESVGEIIPADVATGASTPSLHEGDDNNANPERLSYSEDEAYFCVYDDVETDLGYEARRHQAESQHAQRAQYWDAARQVRDKAGTLVRTGAQMALVGAQAGAASMAASAQDQMTDIMRDLSVRGARNRLAGSRTAENRHLEPPIEGEHDKNRSQASPVSAYLDYMGDPNRFQSGGSSDDDEDSVEDQKGGIVTEGLTVVGGVQPISSPYDRKEGEKQKKKKGKLTGQPVRSTPAPEIARLNKESSNSDEFFDAPEDSTTSAANKAARKATSFITNKEASNFGATAFGDVDLSRSEIVHPATPDDNDDDDFDIITEEEAGRPRYSLDDVGPHVRRPLNSSRDRGRPGIAARPRPHVRSAGFQRLPSPGTMNIAMVSERAHELPHRRRVSRGNGSSSGDQLSN